jgi:hypothetical protein
MVCASSKHTVKFSDICTDRKSAVKHSPAVADDTAMQLIIDEAAKTHGVACPSGFVWHKTAWGYQCAGGGHKLTFEQL